MPDRTPDHLTDIAPRGVAAQSSHGKLARKMSPQAAVGNDLTADFAFHTAFEEGPWWSLDLGEEWPVERIVLHNRRYPALWHRARRIRVETSLDGVDWLCLHEGFVPFGGAGIGDPLVLSLNGRILARHLRLSLPGMGVLHLAGVQVLVRRGIVACRRFEADHGFNLRRPLTGFDPEDFEAPYEIHAASPDEIDGPIRAAAIRRYGRFGNNVNQTLNAIRFAQHFGLEALRLAEIPGLGLDGQQVRDGLTLLPPGAALPEAGAVLEGDFHYPRQFGTVFAGFDRAAQYALAQAWLRPLMRFPDVAGPPGADEVVIHLRAGDIFGPAPHPNYGQPPLAYYQSVVRSLRTEGVGRVCLVYEDRGNPVINELEAWLAAEGLPCRHQSGRVEEDIAFLLAARHLVFGSGTFGHGICLLAGQIASVHAFDRMGLYADLPNIGRLRLAHDAGGGYIPDWGWTNSPEQRQLMIDYPAAAIVIRDA